MKLCWLNSPSVSTMEHPDMEVSKVKNMTDTLESSNMGNFNREAIQHLLTYIKVVQPCNN